MSYKKLIIITYPHFWPYIWSFTTPLAKASVQRVHIVWCIVDHRLSYSRMIWLLPRPLSVFLCVARWAESYDREKAWSSVNHSIFSFYSMHKCMHIIHTVHVKSVTYIYVRTYIYHTYIQERVKNVLIFNYILWFF